MAKYRTYSAKMNRENAALNDKCVNAGCYAQHHMLATCMTQVGTTDINSHTGQKHNHRQRMEELATSIYTQRRHVLVSSVQ